MGEFAQGGVARTSVATWPYRHGPELLDLPRRRCRTDLYKGFIASLGSILVVVSRVLETLGIEGESQLISKLGAACFGHPGQRRPRKAGPGLLLALYTSNPLHVDPVAPGSCVTGVAA
jgi:hypothetical protein